jgi:hypothetical protein
VSTVAGLSIGGAVIATHVLSGHSPPAPLVAKDSGAVLDERPRAPELELERPLPLEAPLQSPRDSTDEAIGDARANASSSVPGVALDEVTGQPVPWLNVELALDTQRGIPLCKCTTAIDGTFVVAGLRAGVKYRLRFTDPAAAIDDAHSIDLRPSPAGGSRRFKVALGPTYFLDVHSDPPIDPATLRARLNIDDLHADLAYARTIPSGWRPVRGERAPWVRFNASFRNRTTREGESPLLCVATSDGLHIGSTIVPGTIGVCTTPLEVTLHAVGALHGVVTDVDAHRRRGVRIELECTDTSIPMRMFSGPEDVRRTPYNGEFSFGCLAAARYIVRAELEGNYPRTATVDVIAGQTAQVRIELQPHDAGTLQGWLLTSDEERWTDAPLVCLSRVGGDKELCVRPMLLTASARLDSAPRAWAHAKFTVCGVPFGEYMLTVLEPWSTTPERVWTPVAVAIERPETIALIESHEPTDKSMCIVEVVDGDSGQPVPRFEFLDYAYLRDELRNETPATFNVRDQSVRIDRPRVAIETDLQHWMVTADGYQPAWGDERAFQQDSSGSQRKHCVVRLHRGWGALVFACRDEETGAMRPMRGATVIGDGQTLGVTDFDGLVGVSALSRPACVKIDRSGYHVVKATGLDGCRVGSDALISVLLRSN